MVSVATSSRAGTAQRTTRRCAACQRRTGAIDYKDYPLLKEFSDYFGNILPRRRSSLCPSHQRQLRRAVERARYLGMLAYRK